MKLDRIERRVNRDAHVREYTGTEEEEGGRLSGENKKMERKLKYLLN